MKVSSAIVFLGFSNKRTVFVGIALQHAIPFTVVSEQNDDTGNSTCRKSRRVSTIFLQICFLRNGKYISDNYPYKRALLYGVKWIGGLKISVKHRTMSDENQQLSN